MGLDIRAYSRLDYIGHGTDGQHDDEDCCYTEDYSRRHIPAYAYDSFPHALEGIPGNPDIRRETGSSGDGFLNAGYFQVTSATETHGFPAGSYGGYNRWREHLGKCFGWSRDTEDPFMELIYFADNEGTILWKPARELLKDFEEGREKWLAYCTTEGLTGSPYGMWYLEVYEDWAQACKLAADGGLLDFH
jgi:hypothetical protein